MQPAEWRAAPELKPDRRAPTEVKLSRRRAAMLASTVLLGLALPAAPALAKASTVKTAVIATAPTLAGRLAAVKTAKSINYYPSTAGWSKMWSSFDATKINADFAKAQALGATNVRAIIFPSTFGYPTPKAEYTDRLATFVSLADAHGMTVRFTLFDWWDGYSDVAGSTAWTSAILKPYKDDDRVISVELQNEFDTTNTAAVAWGK